MRLRGSQVTRRSLVIHDTASQLPEYRPFGIMILCHLVNISTDVWVSCMGLMSRPEADIPHLLLQLVELMALYHMLHFLHKADLSDQRGASIK